MRSTERRVLRLGEADPLEREVHDVQRVVERARRNRWFGGDVLSPEFAPVLAAIVAPRPLRYGALFCAEDVAAGRSAWHGSCDRA
jgi:hypothetical protein